MKKFLFRVFLLLLVQAGATVWLFWHYEVPQSYVIPYPEFSGRIVYSFSYSHSSIISQERFETIGEWGPEAMLVWSGNRWIALRPDPTIQGKFQIARQPVQIEQYFLYRLVTDFEENGLRVSYRLSIWEVVGVCFISVLVFLLGVLIIAFITLDARLSDLEVEQVESS